MNDFIGIRLGKERCHVDQNKSDELMLSTLHSDWKELEQMTHVVVNKVEQIKVLNKKQQTNNTVQSSTNTITDSMVATNKRKGGAHKFRCCCFLV